MSEEEKDEIIRKQAEVITRLTKERDADCGLSKLPVEGTRATGQSAPKPVQVIEAPVQSLRFSADEFLAGKHSPDKDTYIRELEQEIRNLKAYIKRRDMANQ